MSKKLILHIPHSSSNIPDKMGYVVDDARLQNEILLLTDWHTEDLFLSHTAITITASFSRVYCDVERFAEDEHEVMSQFGMGVIYTKCDDGLDLRHVSDELKASILNQYYYPHHERLAEAVKEQLYDHNKALIVDCHSFSNKPFKRDLNQHIPRPDFCIGTDGYHTPRGLFKLAAVIIKMLGYTVKINNPYSGAIVPLRYYNKEKRVYSVMVEVNRDLYLIPGTNLKNENYDKIKSDIQKLLTCISENFGNIKFEPPK